jgi:hypothetical protein
MNRRKSTQKNARNSVVAQRRNQPTRQQFDQLLDIEKTRMGGSTPQVRDKIAMVIKRKKVHTFVQSVDYGSLTPSLTADVIGGQAFQLNQLPTADLTAYQTLFDQYRIVEIAFDFTSLNPSATESPLYTAIDYDSATAPTLASIEQYETLQIQQGQWSTHRVWTPQARLVAYTGATATQAANSTNGQWFDVSSPATSYYGVLWVIPANASSSATPTYRLTGRLVMQFRNIR